MIHLCQTEVAITAAARHFLKFIAQPLVRDTDYLIKTALTETLAGPVIRPWASHSMANGVATVVGYSKLSPDSLIAARALALPGLQQIVGTVIGGAMPGFREGGSFGFEVRISPTIHVTKDGTRRHGERDAYLVAVEAHTAETRLSRESVYLDYLAKRLGGAEVAEAKLDGFRLNRIARKSAKARFGRRVVPQARISGVLRVTDAVRFERTLLEGVGRQRAFGHGMIRLRPAHGQHA